MTGLRLDARQLRRETTDRFAKVRVSDFRPELRRFGSRVLSRCIKTTPARSLSKINAAQRKQYANRVSYIPSIHTLEDPTLVVRDGVHWLYADAKWWPATYRPVPDYLEGVYQELLSEHERRAQTSESDFIAERAQARFLYKKSWWQCGQSLGINITGIPAGVRVARSRHNPRKEPPKGYGQWRGGKNTISVVIQNPFLEQQSRYKPFSGKVILASAVARERAQFDREVQSKMERITA